jgi:hypothetical protein
MTIIVAEGQPITHKSMALNLTQSGTVQLVYAGVPGRPAGASFELDQYGPDEFTDLILKFVEAVIGEREQAQKRRQAEMEAEKTAG